MAVLMNPDGIEAYVTRVVIRSVGGERVGGYEFARVPDGWVTRIDAPHSPTADGSWRGPYESAEAAGDAARALIAAEEAAR